MTHVCHMATAAAVRWGVGHQREGDYKDIAQCRRTLHGRTLQSVEGHY